MANVKISGLPAAASCLSSDQFEVNQGGVSKSVTATQIISAVGLFTPQSVLFAGSGGEISQDNTSFRYDSVTKKMAVGNSSFSSQLFTLGTPGGPGGSMYMAGQTSGAIIVAPDATADLLTIDAGIYVNSELKYDATLKTLSLLANPGAASTGFSIKNQFNNALATASIQLSNADNSQDVRFQAFGQGSSDNAFIGTISATGFDIYTSGLKSLMIGDDGEMVARAGLSLYTNKWYMFMDATYNFVEQTSSTSPFTENLIGNNVTTGGARALLYSNGNAYIQSRVFGSAYTPSGLEQPGTVVTDVGATYGLNLVNSSQYTIYFNAVAKFRLTATTGAATFHSGSITSGITGTTTGTVIFAGGTSGAAILTAAAAAGSPTITLPIGTTTLLGNSLGLASGTILIGSTATTTGLELRATSGVGTTGSNVIITGGNNGAIRHATFINAGGASFGGGTPDIYSGGGSVRYFTVTTATSNDAAFLQVVGSGSGNAAVIFGNNTIRRAAVTGGDGSVLNFSVNLTNSGTTLTQVGQFAVTGAFTVYSSITAGLAGTRAGSLVLSGVTSGTGTMAINATATQFSLDKSLILPASTTTIASICLPHGTAPSSPVDGDIWSTSSGLFVRINGITKSVDLT